MRFLKQMRWFEITLVALVMGVHLYAAFSAPHNFSMKWFTRDDAFYYFKVAQNISEGHGSSFDGINLTNGYHPLWMLICVPIFSLARFDLILPLRILVLVMAALSTTTSILLFRLLKKHTGKAVAMLAASFWAFNLDVHAVITQQGMETGILALSIVFFLSLIQKTQNKAHLEPRDLIQLALAGVFVVLSRLDGIFLVLIVGLWVIFRRTSLRTLLPLDLLLTFSVVVAAYLQRAGLKIYLLSFDNGAMLMAAITFSIQTVIFYFTGLYTHPKNLLPVRLLLVSLIGVSLSALIVTLVGLMLSNNGVLAMPRAVPAFYWLGMLAATLLSRFGLRLLSPWPVTLSKENKPVLGFLAGKNQVLLALEPLRRWLKAAFIYFGIAGTAVSVYMVGNRIMFGTFMPVSGQIKRWWGSIPNDVYGGGAETILDVFALDPRYSQAWRLLTRSLYDWSRQLATLNWTYNGWYWLMVAVLTAGLLGAFLANRKKNLRRIFMVGLFPLLISAQLQAFFYGAVAFAATQEWYWVMQMLTLVLVGALGLAMLIDLLPHTKTVQIATWVFAAAASLALARSFTIELVNRMPLTDAFAGQPYMDTLPILEGFTETGAIIGMTGGGNTGYFINDRTIVNLDGLINSYAYFQALKENTAGKYLANRGLGYIFASKYIITSSMPYRYQFSVDELLQVPGAPVYGNKELMRYVPIR